MPDFLGLMIFFFIFLVISAQLITQIGLSQALSPILIVGDWFDISPTDQAQLSWAIAAYSLTSGTFIVLGGRLGDMIGHRRMFIFGYSWLAVCSLITGFSYYSRSSPILFYVFRGLQGIGPAFLLPNGLALLARKYSPGKRKTFAFAAFGACTPLGFVLGTTFAAIIGQLSPNWAWIYWSMTFVCSALSVSCIFLIPSDDFPIPDKNAFRTFDFMGSITGVAGLLLFNVAWNQVPISGWRSPSAYIPLIVGSLCILAFLVIELKVSEPLFPLTNISPKVVIVLICVACGFGTFGIWVYYYWQFLLVIRKTTPLKAAAQFCPVAVAGICAAGTTGFLFHKKVSARILILIALLGFLIPSILLATVRVEETYWASTFVSVIIAPFGVDVAFPAASLLLSDSFGKDNQGIPASLIATVVNYSISLGLGVAGVAIKYSLPASDADDFLKSIRIASYVACGMAGFGITVALAHVAYAYKANKKAIDD